MVKVCYDSHGVSIGITEAIMGREAADLLTRNLSAVDEKSFDRTNFNPVQGVSCHTLEKACYQDDTLHTALSAALFGENVQHYGPETLVGSRWAWGGSRYNNDTEVHPGDSLNFTIKFKEEGALQIQADCNTVLGSYRAESKSIAITLGPATMMACPPESADQQFLRDLEGAAIWFIKKGDLYFDLKGDVGTMAFFTSPGINTEQK
jgi:heat shock protein HslJ